MKRSHGRWAFLASMALALSPATPTQAQTSMQHLLASQGTSNDSFGWSVSIDGDTAIVGAPEEGNGGAAYIFERVGTTWTEVARLVSSNAQFGDDFGHSVAIRGDRAIVGAIYGTGITQSYPGAAYVYERPAGGWASGPESAILVAPDGLNDDRFGFSVCVEGDRAFVGAPYDHLANFDEGSVYVYEHQGPGTWTLAQKLTSTPTFSGALFGSSLDCDDDHLVVGSQYHGSGGVVFVFELVGSSWVQAAQLLASAGQPNQRLGRSVSIDGPVIAAGAPYRDAPATDSGAVFVFDRPPGGWVDMTESARLSALDADSYDYLGWSVGVSGDLIVAGAVEDEQAGTEAGSAYLFERKSWGWVETAKLIAPDAAPYDYFGTAVAVDGTTALIGCAGHDDQGPTSGAAFVVDVAPDLFTSPYCFCPAQRSPCANADTHAGCTNATGSGALLLDSGSTSVSADDLVLTCTQLPPLQNGMLYMGQGMIQVPFGDGLRCVGSGGVGIFRFTPKSSGSTGVIEMGPGLVRFSQTHFGGGGAIGAGETWNFQVWYRDVLGPCQSGFNFSSALQVTFVP